MSDSWSSDPREPSPTRADRREEPPETAGERRERYPAVGLAFLVVGLVAGAIALALIARDLDRPGFADVEPARWWIVVGGGLAIAWSGPWFVRPRTRRWMAIVLGVCSAAVMAVTAVAIGGLG
ncbi:MAG TPA: hypothetical protein VLA82_08475 [Actinomycetota bacterium]|nr:hypothetical protein [Actinomycetota bacterium]